MQKRQRFADALAATHLKRMADRADESDHYSDNRRALDDYAQHIGFRDRGVWPDLGVHRPPDALWVDGESCFVGEVWRMSSDTPERAAQQLLAHLRSLANAFSVGSVRRALFMFVVDERSEVQRWRVATRKRIREAGLEVVGRSDRVQLGEHGFGMIFTVAPTGHDRQ